MSPLPPIDPTDPYYFAPQWFRQVSPDTLLQSELRRLGDELAAGLLPGQYCILLDFQLGAYVYVSQSVEQVLGYPAAHFTVEFTFPLIHPEDAATLVESSQMVNDYSRAYPAEDLSRSLYTIDLRVRHADGQERRILQQQYVLQRDPTTGNAIVLAGVGTDITVHKPVGRGGYSFSAPGFTAFAQQWQARRAAARSLVVPDRTVLTLTEWRVAKCMLRGCTVREITDELKLKSSSVYAYRRNIYQKIGTQNLATWYQNLSAEERPKRLPPGAEW